MVHPDQQPPERQLLPPESQTISVQAISVQEVQQTLDQLWGQTMVETRSYTGNLVVLTVGRHLERVKEALSGLDGRHAGRQIIGIIDGQSDLRVNVSLVKHKSGFYIEQLILDANEQQLQGGILPLLRPATINYIWWAAPSKPTTDLLKELTELADQVIVNSLMLGVGPSPQFALADLGWSRSANWREALAQVFDSPDAAAQIPLLTDLRVMYAGESDLAARLFAGFIAERLNWGSLEHVTFEKVGIQRENGDLCGFVLSGNGVEFALQAQDSSERVRLDAFWSGTQRHLEMKVPSMSLADGLFWVMDSPARCPIFEKAWKLAHESLLEDKTAVQHPQNAS